MKRNRKKLIEAKEVCNNAKIGEEIICPFCGSSHIKKSYQSVFCKTKGGTKCKDNYWNNVDSNKRNNKTRISPASQRWLSKMDVQREENFNPDDYEHPFSSDALGQW